MQGINGGGGWIRTIEAEKQQIYSLPPLATRELLPKVAAEYDRRYLKNGNNGQTVVLPFIMELVDGLQPPTC